MHGYLTPLTSCRLWRTVATNPGALGNGAGGEQGNVGIRPKASFLEDILCTKFGAFSASMLSLSDSKKH